MRPAERRTSIPVARILKKNKNKCEKNCSCWRAWCSPCLENSSWTVEQPLYRYRKQVQALTPADYRARVLGVLLWLLEWCAVNTQFIANILFTDELGCARDGVMSYPCLGGCQSPQNRRGIKTSSSIFHQCMCRHLRRSALRISYHPFLVNDVPVLLEHVFRRHMWFMLNGAPPHFLRTLGQRMNKTFCEHLIGRRGPVSWPGWSPDHNHMDSWLWVHLKALVYSSLIIYLEKRVGNMFREIQVKP
jgi:hypothetical protein